MAHHFFCCVPDDRARFHPTVWALQARLACDVWMPDVPDWQQDDWYDAVELAIRSADAVIVALTEAFASGGMIAQWLLERIAARLTAPPVATCVVLRCAPLDLPPAMRGSVVIEGAPGDASALEHIIEALRAQMPVSGEGMHPFCVERVARPLVAREAALETLHETMIAAADAARALVALTGPEGAGTSALALAYAHRYRFHYPAGVYWINAAQSWTSEVIRLARQVIPDAVPGERNDQQNAWLAAFSDQVQRRQGDALIILDGVRNPPDVLDRRLGAAFRLSSLSNAQVMITTDQAALPEPFLRVPVVPLPPEAARIWLAPVIAGGHSAPESGEPEDALDALIAALDGLALALRLAETALQHDPTASNALADHVTAARSARPAPDGLAAVAALLDWHRQRLPDPDAGRMLALAAAFDEAVLPVALLRRVAAAKMSVSGDERFAAALGALHAAGLIEYARHNTLWLHPVVRAIVRRTTPDYGALLARGATALIEAYCSPQVLHQESRARGFLALVRDLHQMRLALAAVGAVEPELNRLARLFEWEAERLGDWHGEDHRQGDAYLLHQLRDSAHHQGYDTLRSACDRWLAGSVHLRVEPAWRFPRDPASLGVLRSVTQPLLCVTALPDGLRALSASDDALIQLWNVETGELLRVLAGHEGPVYGMAALPDGRRALSAADDHTLRLWDIATGETLRVYAGHSAGVRSVAVLPDGRRALSAAWDSTLRLWDVHTGETLRILTGHEQSVNTVALLPDGRRALSASFDRMIRVWDLERGQTVQVLAGHQGLVLSVCPMPDGQRVLSASNDRTVRVWTLGDGAVERVLSGHAGSVSDVAALPDGRHALSASADRSLRLWDVHTGETRRVLRGHQGPINAVATLPDGQRALSVSEDGSLRVWNVDLAGAASIPDRERWSVRGLAVLPQRHRAIAALFDGRLQMWDLDTGTMQPVSQPVPEPLLAIAALPGEQRAVVALSDGALRVWDMDSGTTQRTLRGHTLGALALAPLPDGRRLLSGSYDGTLRLWDLRTGETLRVLQDGTDSVSHLALLPGGQHALAASYDTVLRLWSLESGVVVRALHGHHSAVLAVAALPDGRHALSGDHTGALRLWDLQTGETRLELVGHLGPVRGIVALSARWVVSGALDGTLHLWDVRAGTLAAVLHVAEKPVCLARVNGERFAVGDASGGIRVVRASLPPGHHDAPEMLN